MAITKEDSRHDDLLESILRSSSLVSAYVTFVKERIGRRIFWFFGYTIPLACLILLFRGSSIAGFMAIGILGVVTWTDTLADWSEELLNTSSVRIVRDEAPVWITGLFGLLMEPRRVEALNGDLEERFLLLLKEKGRNSATVWFWREVIHSFFSLALAALIRVSGLEKLLRRIGS